MYFRIGFLKSFAMFTGKHLCSSLFLINIQLEACNITKKKLQYKFFRVKFAKSLQNTSSVCFWKYLMNSLFIEFENDEWCHFVELIGSPVLISFCCVCFVSFYLFSFFWLFLWILLLFGFEVNLSILRIKHWSCS